MKLHDIIHYPLKSGASVHQITAEVEPLGIRHDRRFMLIEPDGSFITSRRDPKLLNISLQWNTASIDLFYAGEHRSFISLANAYRVNAKVWNREISCLCLDDASGPLSLLIGRPVRLVYNDELSKDLAKKQYAWGPTFSDGYPLLLTTTASLKALNHASARQYDMARFRPNLVIDNQIPWEEDDWQTFRIGDVWFQRVKPCERCVLITRDPITGKKDPDQEPLRTLARIHRDEDGKINFGQNIVVIKSGTIQLGDTLTLIN